MKRWYAVLVIATSILMLAGCAHPTIRSEVTILQQWQPSLLTQPYVFERTMEQDKNIEYRSYENLVRAELQRLGLQEASPAQKPKLTVRLEYGIQSRDVRIVEPVVVDPLFYNGPLYGPRWHRRYTPFYDPFWYGPAVVQYREGRYIVFRRQLHVVIASATEAQKFFDVTVVSDGNKGALPAVMPYLVRSAFADFPGKNGVPRQIELEIKE
jgi:hypothetical protein